MNNRYLCSTIGSIAVIFLLSINIAFAAGTPAGTVISSRAKALFTTASGAVSDSVFSNIVQFTVAHVAAVNIDLTTAAKTTTSDSVNVDYPFILTNSGNDNDSFTISAASTKSFTRTYYFDTNGDGVLQPGEAGSAITSIPSIAADTTYKFIVRILVPKNSALNGQSDVTTVTFKSVFDTTKTVSTVITTTVNTANFGTSPIAGFAVNNASPNAGDNVTYTFTLTNNGSVPATNVIITDALPLGVTFVSATPAGSTFSGGTNTWNIGTINAAGAVTVTITVNIPSGTAVNTAFNNNLGIQYNVGTTTHTITTNNRPITVGVTRLVAISPSTYSITKEPEDSIKYYFTAYNNGNAADVLEISYSSSRSYVWTFLKDVNNNGIIDAADSALTNTNALLGIDVGLVAYTDSVKIFAVLVTPVVTTDQLVENTTFTVTSAGDNAKFQSAVTNATINIPVMSLTPKTVTGTAPYIPGTDMTYTIPYSNTGHGKAYNFTVVDIAPDSTVYVANSVVVNGTPYNDNVSPVSITTQSGTGNKIVTVTLGTINPSASGTVSYKVKIKE